LADALRMKKIKEFGRRVLTLEQSMRMKKIKEFGRRVLTLEQSMDFPLKAN
jgi:hypothetical protein